MSSRAEQVITAMRERGLVLLRMHMRGRIVWMLSNGTVIPHETAFDIINDPRVAPGWDTLFGSETPLLSQTFRLSTQQVGDKCHDDQGHEVGSGVNRE
jgi:hypothetical protein